jgi:hypothetical protein
MHENHWWAAKAQTVMDGGLTARVFCPQGIVRVARGMNHCVPEYPYVDQNVWRCCEKLSLKGLERDTPSRAVKASTGFEAVLYEKP